MLERNYPVSVERLWAAFADLEIKKQLFGSSDFIDVQRVDDFRVGGIALHASTSITTIGFEATADTRRSGTRIRFIEQGVHRDDVHGPGSQAAAGREHGTGELLDKIGALLAA